MDQYWKITKDGERMKLDAFHFASEIGKYVDGIAGPLADETTIATLLTRAEEQARTETGLRLADGSLLKISDNKIE